MDNVLDSDPPLLPSQLTSNETIKISFTPLPIRIRLVVTVYHCFVCVCVCVGGGAGRGGDRTDGMGSDICNQLKFVSGRGLQFGSTWHLLAPEEDDLRSARFLRSSECSTSVLL